MAMKTMIQGQVRNAMALLKSQGLGETITYYRAGEASYDPSTGAVTPSLTTYADIPAVLPGFSMEEKDDKVVVLTDRKALIAYTDLPFEVSEEDWFTTSNGDKWEVVRALGVPGDSLHKIHVRRK